MAFTAAVVSVAVKYSKLSKPFFSPSHIWCKFDVRLFHNVAKKDHRHGVERPVELGDEPGCLLTMMLCLSVIFLS